MKKCPKNVIMIVYYMVTHGKFVLAFICQSTEQIHEMWPLEANIKFDSAEKWGKGFAVAREACDNSLSTFLL